MEHHQIGIITVTQGFYRQLSTCLQVIANFSDVSNLGEDDVMPKAAGYDGKKYFICFCKAEKKARAQMKFILVVPCWATVCGPLSTCGGAFCWPCQRSSISVHWHLVLQCSHLEDCTAPCTTAPPHSGRCVLHLHQGSLALWKVCVLLHCIKREVLWCYLLLHAGLCAVWPTTPPQSRRYVLAIYPSNLGVLALCPSCKSYCL